MGWRAQTLEPWVNVVWHNITSAHKHEKKGDVWGVLFTPPVGCSRLPSAENDPVLKKNELHQFLSHCLHEELEEEDGCHLWYWWKGMGSGRSSRDSRWRRFINVTAVRKSDRSLIGAFLPDLFSVRYQFFSYLSYSSKDRRQEWSSCANLSIAMHFSSVQPILSCESRFSGSRWKRSWIPS